MIADPSVAIQRAVYKALTGSTALVAALGTAPGVFDRPPQEAKLPWILIGQDDIRDDSADDLDGAEVTVTVHIYADGNLSKVKGIARQVLALLATTLDLSADAQRCVTALVESVRHLDDPDGETWHSIVTVTYRTEPTA